MSLPDYLWVGLAGSARFAGKLPLGTMLINVTGSVLLGFFVGLVAFDGSSDLWKTVAGTGFCRGYTTFSTASF